MIASTTVDLPTLQTPAEELVVGNYFVAGYPPFSSSTPAQVPALHAALKEPSPARRLGLYIHLPFCPKKCAYPKI